MRYAVSLTFIVLSVTSCQNSKDTFEQYPETYIALKCRNTDILKKYKMLIQQLNSSQDFVKKQNIQGLQPYNEIISLTDENIQSIIQIRDNNIFEFAIYRRNYVNSRKNKNLNKEYHDMANKVQFFGKTNACNIVTK